MKRCGKCKEPLGYSQAIMGGKKVCQKCWESRKWDRGRPLVIKEPTLTKEDIAGEKSLHAYLKRKEKQS